jgi:hypothetical protein
VSESTRAPAAQVVVASLAADRQPLTPQEAGGHVPLVPVGICHGAWLGHETTLCGLRTQALTWFPGLSFGDAQFLPRCPSCLEILDRAPA